MALKDLKSNLSWYGKESPGPYKPNADYTDTKFQGVDNIPFVETSGYGFQGVSTLSPVTRFAGDSFIIDDVTFSTRGAASRAAQLGSGTVFPGGNHSFDIPRTGFNVDSKYGDTYGVKFGNSGLANTYTENSPIDDMYNKFNLRDDATPNPGYVKQPFILRGIQREGSSDPQRWGLGETTVGKIFSTLDLPRAGILTSAERSAIDAARIGKFLISPRGIGFLARQFGYQLMNPNIENLAGTALNLPATQLYNPLSAPGQALVGGLLGVGKFTRHSSLTSLPTGGGGEYGGIKNLQRASNIILGPKAGRIIKLYDQYEQGGGFIGQTWSALTAPKGPGSILGIGRTVHTRTTMTDLKNQSSPYGGLPGGITAQLTSLIGIGGAETTYNTSFGEKFFRWNTDNQYQGETELQIPETGGGNATTADDSGVENIGKTYYKTNTYEQIKTTSAGRDANTVAINDYRLIEGDPVPYDKTEEENPLVKKTTEINPIAPHIEPERQEKPFDGGGLNESSNAIHSYKALEYPNLVRDVGNVKKSFKDNTNYENTNTRISKYGIDTNQTDPIQSIEAFSDYDTVKDLIKFKFTPLRITDTAADTQKPIIFRAFLSNVSDAFAPQWDEKQDQGRADAKIMLSGWGRSIALDFAVPVMSKAELNPVWGKLDELAKLTYPIYAKSGFTGTYCKVTIGDLYNDIPMYVQDLSYDWDNETPWELENGQQVPLYTNVSMTLGWIGIQRPDYKTAVFSYKPTSE